MKNMFKLAPIFLGSTLAFTSGIYAQTDASNSVVATTRARVQILENRIKDQENTSLSASRFRIEPNNRYLGMVSSTTNGVANYQQCAKICIAATNCQIFVYTESEAKCELQNSRGSKRAQSGVVSGVLVDSELSKLELQVKNLEDTKNLPNSIGSTQIKDNAVGASEIATGAVGALEIANDAVGSNEIQVNAVGSSEIASNAVGSSEIASNAVGSSEIADNAVGSSEIAANAVGASEIATGAVGTLEIATNAVGFNEIAANAVRASEIASNAVGSSEIATGAVTSSKIADDAVTSSKIANSAVGWSQIAPNAIGTSKISDGTVKSQHLSTYWKDCKISGYKSHYDCSCDTNETVLSGGGYGSSGSWQFSLRESRPTSKRTWRIACVDRDGRKEDCAGMSIICLRAR
ncbi:PAN domain-containing protein [Pseudobacteriovorax antillogorgiicola]|nr:PAN domain-containing protein [Pseudobacteriovorax antillogorgiicola]